MIALAVSAVMAAVLAPGALRAFTAAGRTRENYRGTQLAFPAGTIAIAAGILALGALAVAERLTGSTILGVQHGWTSYPPGGIETPFEAARAWLPLWLGVAFLGLLDDVLDLSPRGWRGHARALAGGGFSTGALKALGTAALAYAVTGDVLASVVIALATNLFNLLDLRPGRAAKCWVILIAAVTLAEWDIGPLKVTGVLAGALLVLGVYDLRERCMLGDTGANVLGALAGTHLVLALGTTGRWIAAGILLAITIFAELRSISATVDRVPPLRALDSLGRRMHA